MALFEYEKLETALKLIAETTNIDTLSDELVRMIDSHTTLEQYTANRLLVAEALVKRIIKLGDRRALDYNHNGDGSYLHLCLMSYDVGITNILIKNGADMRVKNSYNQTPFDIAILLLRTSNGEKRNSIARIIDILN